jgi:hypothetical protein
MIALDLDGTILNYGDHTTQLRVNLALLDRLPGPQPVSILTNQGGMCFSKASPAKYPTPLTVAARLETARDFLSRAGYTVAIIHVSAWHPRGDSAEIQRVAAELRRYLPVLAGAWHVYTTERARKPFPLMLRAAGATVYYGDSTEDTQAAVEAGIPFVSVPRFL